VRPGEIRTVVQSPWALAVTSRRVTRLVDWPNVATAGYHRTPASKAVADETGNGRVRDVLSNAMLLVVLHRFDSK
jgi:hypothetical protein